MGSPGDAVDGGRMQRMFEKFRPTGDLRGIGRVSPDDDFGII